VVLGYINQGQAKCNGHFHGISYVEPKISCKLVFRETPKQVGYIWIYTYIQSYIYIYEHIINHIKIEQLETWENTGTYNLWLYDIL
jgi:hypothetical protein